MPGFDNNTMYADNVDFRGVTPIFPQMTANGQLLIGSGAAPRIRVGGLTSAGATIAITTAPGTINLETGGVIATLFTAENATTCTPAAGNLNIVGTATNGINTTAAGNTMTIAMASPFVGDFIFENNIAATPRYLMVENNDTDPGSYAAIAVSAEPAGGDAYVFFEVDGATQYYSLGIDNSVAGDPFKLTNNANPSTGDVLIGITNVGVITLFNDLDVTEGGTGVSTLTSHGILMGNGAGDIQATAEPSDGQILIGDTAGFPILATLTAGTGIGIVNAAGSVTINGTGGGLTWVNVGASTALLVNTGFICNAGAALSFSLPAVSAVGAMIELVLDGAASWTVTQGAGQQIRLGSLTTTAGAGGSLASTASGDAIRMVCRTANTLWSCVGGVIGNITVN